MAVARSRDAIARIRARGSSGASNCGRLDDFISKVLKAAQITEIAIETIGGDCVSCGKA